MNTCGFYMQDRDVCSCKYMGAIGVDGITDACGCILMDDAFLKESRLTGPAMQSAG